MTSRDIPTETEFKGKNHEKKKKNLEAELERRDLDSTQIKLNCQSLSQVCPRCI